MDAEVRKKVLNSIREALPEYFKIADQDIYSPKTIYNMVSKGIGPPIVDIRGQKFLERDSWLAWLDDGSRNTLKRGRKRSGGETSCSIQ